MIAKHDAEYWKDRYYEQQANHTEARGILCDERDRALKRADKAEREVAELREALAWYADKKNWQPLGLTTYSAALKDRGMRARETLKSPPAQGGSES